MGTGEGSVQGQNLGQSHLFQDAPNPAGLCWLSLSRLLARESPAF